MPTSILYLVAVVGIDQQIQSSRLPSAQEDPSRMVPHVILQQMPIQTQTENRKGGKKKVMEDLFWTLQLYAKLRKRQRGRGPDRGNIVNGR